MNIKNSVLDYIRYKPLKWYGHVHRVNEERLPRRILGWCLPGRRRKGRSRNSCLLEVTTGMRERGIGDLEWSRERGEERKLIYLRHRKM